MPPFPEGNQQMRHPSHKQETDQTPVASQAGRSVKRSSGAAGAAPMGRTINQLQAKGAVQAVEAVHSAAAHLRGGRPSDREAARADPEAEAARAAGAESAGAAAPRSGSGGWRTRTWPGRFCGCCRWLSSAWSRPRAKNGDCPSGGIFHDYYVLTMSAPMAALTGIGGAALWKSFHSVHRDPVSVRPRGAARYLLEGWRSLLLPLAILLTAGWQALIWLNYPELAKWSVPALLIAATAASLGLLALRGSWWAPVLTVGLLACIGWLWSRDNAAPDILAVAAGELDEARTALRNIEGWDSLKKLYTKFSPDIGTVLPDLRRQAPLVSPWLLLGCSIAGGCLLVVFLLAKWLAKTKGQSPFSEAILAKGGVVAAAVGCLALYVGPGVWALSPLWGIGGMLPAADASVLARAIREREQRAEQQVQEAARVAALSVTVTNWAASPSLVAAPVTLFASDLALLTRGVARVGRPALAGSGPGNRGGQPGAPAPGFAGGFRGPGMLPRDNEHSRQERQKLVAFLKANDNGERWLMAVSGHQQSSSYIIEDGLSVMPIGGFGGGAPIFGTDPEEIKTRLTKLVDAGQIRFLEVGGGRGGFPGGPRRPTGGFGPQGRTGGGGGPVPQGGALVGGGPSAGFGRGSAGVSQWVQEQVEKGKAKRVDRKLYTSEASPETTPGGRRAGRDFGMMAGGDLYDLHPELGLREPTP
jgi:hypothetical protein